jgi:hypothetical protein
MTNFTYTALNAVKRGVTISLLSLSLFPMFSFAVFTRLNAGDG